ncbi:DUF1707 domain-containing protein [Pseudonocardia zijingensis]|uniref:DUF1707 domain-containing protein n=1 Tax=Pseudonocardia zijingensis TaxID=153376 RepID=A0ABN1NF79_9PSEU
MDEPPGPELRIGDRERRAVDSHLQQAHADGVLTLIEYDERAAKCWAARTRSDLDELVRDLPPYRPGPDEAPTVAVPEPGAVGEQRTGGQRLVRGAVGVLAAAAALFVGAQVVTADDAVAIFGDRSLTAGEGTERIQVGSLFSDVRVVVPEGMRARTTGGLVFGDTHCDLACAGPGPEVVVDVTGAFSDIDVLRPGELTAEEKEELAEEQEDAIEDAEDDD